MKKSIITFITCLSLIVPFSFAQAADKTPLSAPQSPATQAVNNQLIQDLASGAIQPVIEDDISDLHVLFQSQSDPDAVTNMLTDNKDIILNVKKIGNNEYSALALLTRSDTNGEGGVLAFLEVTYQRQNYDGLNFVRISTVYGGWRSSNSSNLICSDLQLHYKGIGDSFGILKSEEDHSSVYSTPAKGTAYTLVPDQTNYFLEDGSTGMTVGYMTYKAKNTSSGSVLADTAIYIGFGDLSGFNPYG